MALSVAYSKPDLAFLPDETPVRFIVPYLGERFYCIVGADSSLEIAFTHGIIHARLNTALVAHRLIFPPDPGSSRMCTVGGMASTNAHGMRAMKYGPTANWVLGLDVVLPDGRLITTGSVRSKARQSSSGLELTKLFVGAEGILGIITRLRLKVMPIPESRTSTSA